LTDHDGPTDSARGPAKIFFSYSREDRDRAIPIIRALESAGLDVWWDGLLEGGTKYIEQTETALTSADAVVVLWSKTSIGSHWVQDEAMHGRDSERLIPVQIDNVDPPLGFRQFQAIDLIKWDGSETAPAMQNIVRRVTALRDGTALPPTPISQTAPDTLLDRLSRRRLLALGLTGGVALTGALAASRLWSSGAPPGLLNSVAVLPFENDSRDPEQDYLSSGVANELRNALARNAGLRVMARSTSEDVKERRLTPDSIAQQLGITFVVEGAVRVAGDVVNVSSSLIEGPTGLRLWTETYSQPLTELLDMQQALTNAIAAELAFGVSTALGETNIGAPSNAVAYDAYLRGWMIYRNSVATETDLQALDRFDQAIRLDPGFASAHAGRSATLIVLGNTSDNSERAQFYYDHAIDAAREAVRLGPDLDEAHSVLALALFESQLKIEDARAPYERSLELGRGSALIQARYAEYAALTGRDTEARQAIEVALALDPLNPTIFRTAALVDYAAGRYDQAIAANDRALALSASTSDAHAWSGYAHLQAGRTGEALGACQNEQHALVAEPCLAITYYRMGQVEKSDAALNSLIEQYGDNGLYQQAQVLAQTGKLDQAMEVLNAALEIGDAGLTYLGMDPFLDPLRERSDFIRLQNTLGFT